MEKNFSKENKTDKKGRVIGTSETEDVIDSYIRQIGVSHPWAHEEGDAKKLKESPEDLIHSN